LVLMLSEISALFIRIYVTEFNGYSTPPKNMLIFRILPAVVEQQWPSLFLYIDDIDLQQV